MNENALDLHGAIWEPRNNFEEYSFFVGDSYPIMRQMPHFMHDVDDMPFMKHRCVFTAHRQIDGSDDPAPDLCNFSMDGSPSWGTILKSCQDFFH